MSLNNEIPTLTSSTKTPLVTVVTSSEAITVHTEIPSESTPMVCFGSGLPPVNVHTQLTTQQVVLPTVFPPQVAYAPTVPTVMGQGQASTPMDLSDVHLPPIRVRDTMMHDRPFMAASLP